MRKLTHSIARISPPAFLLVLLFTAGRVIIPTPAIIDVREANGTVFFASNRSTVWSANTCLTLWWQVDNIDEVYLNGDAQIGSGEAQDCDQAEVPNLRVIFRDGSEQIYTLPIWVVNSSLVMLILPVLAIVTAFRHKQKLKPLAESFQPTVSPHPRLAALDSPSPMLWRATNGSPLGRGWGVRLKKRVSWASFGYWLKIAFPPLVPGGVLLLALIILIALFAQQLPALIETAATLNWRQASTALADIFSLTGLLAFVALILFARLFRQERQFSNRAFWVAGGMGAALALLVTAATILNVNPRGMYFSDRYVAHQLILRGSKTQGYFARSAPPDVVVMGSSRAFTLSPAYIYEKTGLTAYNMAVEGGRIEDFLIQSRQLQPFPKALLIEVQEGLPREPNDIAARAPLRWLPYMHVDTALLTLQKRLERMIDLDQFAESIHIANFAELYERQPNEWPRFNADGFAARRTITAPELEQAILTDIGNIPPARCEGVDEVSQDDVAQLIEIAESYDSAVIFYISPLHPRYYDERLRDEPEYQRCYATFTAYMGELMREHERVFFLDYSRLASIDGADDESGYYDSQHLTEANSRRLIDHAADTLANITRDKS